MKTRFAKKCASIGLAVVMVCSLAGCGGGTRTENEDRKDALSYEDAQAELSSLMKKVAVTTEQNPTLDIDADEISEADALADISTFPLTVTGSGDIDIEIAAATEMSAEAPDDWMNLVAKDFNKEGYKIGNKTVSVSVRKITSGEGLTYIVSGGYRPQVFAPSNYAWGEMLRSSGVGVEKLTDRIAGNTAGILIKKDVYDKFIEKYKEATVGNVMEATINQDLVFAYTNPYTSSTGLNILAEMLKSFDENDPLSQQAVEKLTDYQKVAPTAAYTTAVLRNKAAKGIINAMVMEEQAYVNTPELKGYEYIPAGIRHDHPVYTFDYCSEEEKEAAKLFVEYCQNEKSQKLASQKGFNLHDDYDPGNAGLDGAGYLAAQKVWKQNKNGGKPIIAVFVADVSSRVKINLPIAQFDATQRAYFSGEVKGLSASGSTATYDAVLTGLQMLEEKAKEVPDAKLMLFLLTDGDQNEGYTLDRITGIVGGLQVPIYSIAYNYDNTGELEKLSNINEAAFIKADSDDIANQLRNLFNVQI